MSMNFTPNSSLPALNAANTVEVLTPNVFKQGDTFNDVRVLLKRNDVPVDLNNATVVWSAAGAKGTVIAERPATVYPGGEIAFAFTEEDKGAWGTLRIEFKVTYLTGEIEKFPANDHVRLHVTRSHDDLNHTPVLFASISYFNQKVEEAAQSAEEANQRALLVEGQGALAQAQGEFAQAQGEFAQENGTLAKDLADNTKFVESYNVTTTYEKNNVVSFNGASYMAKRATTGNTPTDLPGDLNWGLLSRKGTDGTGTVHVHKEIFEATEGQTVFTLANTYDQFQYRTSVIVGRVPQDWPENYEETTPNSITLVEGVPAGTSVKVEYFSESIPLQSDIQTTVDNHTGVITDHTLELDDHAAQLVSNAKKTESFVGSSAFLDIQTAINSVISTKTKLKIPNGIYNFTQGLVIDGRLDLEGSLNDVEFNFSAMASGIAMTFGNLNAINGLIISGLKLKGTPNLTALKLNGTADINKPITDSAFRDIRIENFGIGLVGSYSWCNSFDNIRFQNCVKPMQLDNQFNNIEFSRVSLVTSSTASTFTNCEGINFTTPNIANVTGNAFSLFQSNVSIINPYYEYISGYLAAVGGSNEVNPSSFTSIGGKSTDIEVKIGITGKRATLLLKNLSPSAKFIVDDFGEAITPRKYSHRVEMDSNEMYENDFIVKWDGTTPAPFVNSYGGVTLTKSLHPNKYARVTTDGGITSGFQIANLTVGERYVFVYSLRKQIGATVNVKLGALSTQPLETNEGTEEFEVRYLPFTAKDILFRLMWSANTTLDISFLGIVKGSKFPQIPKNKGDLSATTMPTTEAWKVGDIVWNVGSDLNVLLWKRLTTGSTHVLGTDWKVY